MSRAGWESDRGESNSLDPHPSLPLQRRADSPGLNGRGRDVLIKEGGGGFATPALFEFSSPPRRTSREAKVPSCGEGAGGVAMGVPSRLPVPPSLTEPAAKQRLVVSN
jgi:hypothetical protein